MNEINLCPKCKIRIYSSTNKSCIYCKEKLRVVDLYTLNNTQIAFIFLEIASRGGLGDINNLMSSYSNSVLEGLTKEETLGHCLEESNND